MILKVSNREMAGWERRRFSPISLIRPPRGSRVSPDQPQGRLPLQSRFKQGHEFRSPGHLFKPPKGGAEPAGHSLTNKSADGQKMIVVHSDSLILQICRGNNSERLFYRIRTSRSCGEENKHLPSRIRGEPLQVFEGFSRKRSIRPF